MIIRIVKMTFQPNRVADFEALFAERKEQIRTFPGCLRLELLRDAEAPENFFTYSWWTGEDALESYRNSELFRTVWGPTKALFAGRPEAWSCTQQTVLA